VVLLGGETALESYVKPGCSSEEAVHVRGLHGRCHTAALQFLSSAAGILSLTIGWNVEPMGWLFVERTPASFDFAERLHLIGDSIQFLDLLAPGLLAITVTALCEVFQIQGCAILHPEGRSLLVKKCSGVSRQRG
jgi:hypothetical protein